MSPFMDRLIEAIALYSLNGKSTSELPPQYGVSSIWPVVSLDTGPPMLPLDVSLGEP